MPQKRENKFVEELKNFIDQEVLVIGTSGTQYEGVCVSISVQHMNIVLETKAEVVAIKNVQSISRKK